MAMQNYLRLARPVRNLAQTTAMYCKGLNLDVLGRFENHQGFDGVMLGNVGMDYHFEFTHYRTYPVEPTPTNEDLTVFYIPAPSEWQAACALMLAAGFKQVASFNPYWEIQGQTFEDHDGYRIVLENAKWHNQPTSFASLESNL